MGNIYIFQSENENLEIKEILEKKEIWRFGNLEKKEIRKFGDSFCIMNYNSLKNEIPQKRNIYKKKPILVFSPKL